MRSSQRQAVTANAYQQAARVRFAGSVARPALTRSRGITQTVPGFEATPFRLAAGTLVWVGLNGPLHPRTVLVEAGPTDGTFCLDVESIDPTAPPAKTVGGQEFSANDAPKTSARAIGGILDSAKPAGFGVLFRGGLLPFPLSHRKDSAQGLARAVVRGEADAVVRCAVPLLGVGAGLTPSGDDFVGGALFALRLMHGSPHWGHAARTIVAHATQRTHSVSATLLSDLADGRSYASMHEFAAALARGDADRAVSHGIAVAAIGSSSGWDMLAGFMAALTGTIDFSCP